MMAAPTLSDGIDEGTVVDSRYRICQEIGRGNMGTVYLATDELTGREVALKVMSQRLIGRRDRVQRFLNEYEFSIKVGRHENVVATLAQGRLDGDDGVPYLVMERIVGPSLDLMLAMHRRLDPEQASRIALGIAKGVEAMHRAGVVHRDIKPSNVIVAQLDDGKGGTAKLLDFGLATNAKGPHEGEQRPRLTLHEQIPGSSGYMAPEVAEHAEPHTSADVFGFGMVLVELLTGCNPYDGASRGEYLVEVSRRDWMLPPAVLEQLQVSGLDALVMACTQRLPENRPRMAEVVRHLEDGFDPQPVAVDSMSATNPRLTEKAEITAECVSPSWRWFEWLKAGLVALVVVLVCGALGWAVLVARQERSDSERRDRSAEPQPWSAPLTALASSGDVGGETTAEPPAMASSDEDSSSSTSGDGSTTAADEPIASERRQRGRKQPRVQRQDDQPDHDGFTGRSTTETPREPAPSAAECELLQDSVSAMRTEGGWSRILFLIEDRRACFGRSEYRRLRVEALARSGKYDQCMKAGANSDDPEVVAWVAKCKEMGQ